MSKKPINNFVKRNDMHAHENSPRHTAHVQKPGESISHIIVSRLKVYD